MKLFKLNNQQLKPYEHLDVLILCFAFAIMLRYADSFVTRWLILKFSIILKCVWHYIIIVGTFQYNSSKSKFGN